MGDKLLLKLNIYGKPIANKYCEGKVKRTLKRGLKDLKLLRRKWKKSNHLCMNTELRADCLVDLYFIGCLLSKLRLVGGFSYARSKMRFFFGNQR